MSDSNSPCYWVSFVDDYHCFLLLIKSFCFLEHDSIVVELYVCVMVNVGCGTVFVSPTQ
jgi:hypothetical protein